MATIRIRFVAGGGPISAGIRAAQLGFPFTHVDAEEPDGLLGAHLDGVKVRPVGYDTATRRGERWFTLYVDDAAAAAFHDFLRAQLGKPYDLSVANDFAWSAIAGEGANPPRGAWRTPERWFCSELVAAALVRAEVLPGELAAEAGHVTPESLMFAVAAIAHRAQEQA